MASSTRRAAARPTATAQLPMVERYDLATKSWEEVAPMVTPHEDHTVAALDGKLYAVGGYNDGILSSVERYDPVTNAWEAAAPFTTAWITLGITVV